MGCKSGKPRNGAVTCHGGVRRDRGLRQSRNRRLGQLLLIDLAERLMNLLMSLVECLVDVVAGLVQCLLNLDPGLCDGLARLMSRFRSGSQCVAMCPIDRPLVPGCDEPSYHHDEKKQE
jgi:hypothetical protein